MKKLFIFKILVILLLVSNILLIQTSTVEAFTIDGIIDGADKFITDGKAQDAPIDQTGLENTSDDIYNVLLGIAIAVAVLVAAFLGVKFMLASAEDKAKYKEAMIPFVLGCIVAFGSFGIWKIAMKILGSI